MSKKKVIIFAFKSLFPDRTDQAFYKALELVFDLTYYGPGYLDIDLLEEDLAKVCDDLGPFDAAFVHKDILVYQHQYLGKHMFKFNDGVTRFLFNKKKLVQKKPNFGLNYDNLPCESFLISMLFDYQMFNSWFEDIWGAFPGRLFMPPPQVVSKLEDLPDLHKERFYPMCSDDYYKFCCNNKNKIIPLAHMVSSDEFIYTNAHQRKRRVAIPGVLYTQRKSIFSQLSKSHICTLNKTLPHTLLTTLFKLRLIKYNYTVFEDIFRKLFINIISSSLVTYTEGSRLRAFIKKFIEIPTYGSLLICEPFTQAEHFGFIHNTNCVHVNSENIVDIVDDLLSNLELVDSIAKSGQQMVYETHSSHALAPHFKSIVESTLSKQLESVIWKSGKMQLNLNSH